MVVGQISQTSLRTVCGMLVGCRLSRVWHHCRAHRFFSLADWSVDELGLKVAGLIVERLAERPRAVGELARELPISRPAVSQHLRVLKEARLVTERPEGTRRIYRLDPIGVGVLRADLDRFWNRALAAYKAIVEQPHEEDR